MQSTNFFRKPRLRAATVAALALCGAIAAAPQAHAVNSYKVLASPCLNLRSTPTGGIIGCIPVNTYVPIDCTTTGPNVTGPYGTTNIWDHTVWSGLSGYVSDAWIYTGTSGPVAGGCGSGTPRATGTKRYSNSGAPGNCAWGAYDIWWRNTGRSYYPALTGDAMNWDNSARSTGWTVVLDAQPRSIVVFEPYVQGASSVGHVAYVDRVDVKSDGRWIAITEMNAKGLNVWSTRYIKDVAGMSYILQP